MNLYRLGGVLLFSTLTTATALSAAPALTEPCRET